MRTSSESRPGNGLKRRKKVFLNEEKKHIKRTEAKNARGRKSKGLGQSSSAHDQDDRSSNLPRKKESRKEEEKVKNLS